MREDVRKDLGDSAFEFQRLVWPEIGPRIGGGYVIPVEAVSDHEFAKELDVLAGIDAWHIIKKRNCVRALASRVQWTNRPYDTFTIRYKRDSGTITEYTKRLDAFLNKDKGYLYPHVTIQAYVSTPRRNGLFLSAGACQTERMFSLIEDNILGHRGMVPRFEKTGYQWGTRRTDNATFIVASWDWLAKNGVQVVVSSK